MTRKADRHPTSSLLETLALRVRRSRRDRSWTRQQLAERSGLSVRFLARIEAGSGNVSVLRLEELAGALGTTPAELVRPLADPSRFVALVGLRGAGKSTVGALLARRLDMPFVEMDELITEASGLSLGELFELHGESYYRRLEHETLRRFLDRERPAVLAAAGGVVNEASSWQLLSERATVVWLRARPEDHWNRVVAQGDRRPMADHPDAMQELRALLRAREATYGTATITIDTTDGTPQAIAARLARALACPPNRSAPGATPVADGRLSP